MEMAMEMTMVDGKIYWEDTMVCFSDFGGSVSYSARHRTIILLCNGGDPPDTLYFLPLDEVLHNPILTYEQLTPYFVTGFSAWNNDIFMSDDYVVGSEDRHEQTLTYRVFRVPTGECRTFSVDHTYTIQLHNNMVSIVPWEDKEGASELQDIDLNQLYYTG